VQHLRAAFEGSRPRVEQLAYLGFLEPTTARQRAAISEQDPAVQQLRRVMDRPRLPQFDRGVPGMAVG
jgi:hypothetical protein